MLQSAAVAGAYALGPGRHRGMPSPAMCCLVPTSCCVVYSAPPLAPNVALRSTAPKARHGQFRPSAAAAAGGTKGSGAPRKGFGAPAPAGGEGEGAGSGQRCPCGSRRFYRECCGPYNAHEARPPTAEAQLRARFTAFVKGNQARAGLGRPLGCPVSGCRGRAGGMSPLALVYVGGMAGDSSEGTQHDVPENQPVLLRMECLC
jgi:hypothetical protein